jgi:para-nitrobenzyl esterase
MGRPPCAQGVIVVTIAYRLGPLGFLAHPELTANLRTTRPEIHGLMDQIAALEWIQKISQRLAATEERNHRRSILRINVSQHPEGSPLAKACSARHRRESGSCSTAQLARYLLATLNATAKSTHFTRRILAPATTQSTGSQAHGHAGGIVTR